MLGLMRKKILYYDKIYKDWVDITSFFNDSYFGEVEESEKEFIFNNYDELLKFLNENYIELPFCFEERKAAISRKMCIFITGISDIGSDFKKKFYKDKPLKEERFRIVRKEIKLSIHDYMKRLSAENFVALIRNRGWSDISLLKK